MTCLIDEVLDGEGMKSHASLLGTLFVKMYLGTTYVNFQEKYLLERVGKNVPNREACDFIPSLSRTSSIKQVIVVIC